MNETIVSDSVLSKIKKLLALSGSDNQAEAELALSHAQRLAAEHNVNLALINIFDKTKKSAPIEKKEDISLGNRKSISQRFVTQILGNYFNVRCLYTGSRYGGMRLILVGTKENIEMAEYVNGYLNATFMNLWRNYYSKSNCQLSERGSFLVGLTQGLSNKLETEQKNVVTEKLQSHTEDTRNQFSLMVVNEKERLKEAVNGFFPSLRRAAHYQAKSYSSNVINDGIVAGSQINIRKSLNSGVQSNRIAA